MRKFVGEYIRDAQDEQMIYASTGPHSTLESAAADAVAKSKTANVIEWVAVHEYEWRGDKRTGEWERVSRHYGDYDALVQDLCV